MNKVDKKAIKELTEILGPSGLTSDSEKCLAYSIDETLPGFDNEYSADVVCFPEDTKQVSKILKFANERLIPVTPRGAGTGLSGGAVPVSGGIVMSMERMNSIIEIAFISLNKVNEFLFAYPGKAV